MKKIDEILKKGWLVIALIMLVFSGAMLDNQLQIKYAYEVGLYASFVLSAIIVYMVVRTWINEVIKKKK